MNVKRIVITGGPSTGKTTIINHLKTLGYSCLDELSRQITLDAKKQGIEQLFLTDPLLFSEKLLEGRINQFDQAASLHSKLLFYDRGIHDVLAYMNYVEQQIPESFTTAAKEHKYDMVFILKPWDHIFEQDNERYETFDEAKKIHAHLVDTYTHYGYSAVDVPFGTVEARTDFIVNTVKTLC